MASSEPLDAPLFEGSSNQDLATSWRKLTRTATIVAVLTSPALFVWFNKQNGWSWWVSLLATVAVVIVFRGFSELFFTRLIPRASLFGLDSPRMREEDVVSRRRAWFWRFWLKIGIFFFLIVTLVWLSRGGSYFGTVGAILDSIGNLLSNSQLWIQVVFVFFLFFANFAILFGPLLLMNMSQMRSFEPGDAEWGVKIGDVRGQAEAKEEVRRVVTIWQSGEQFEKHGGKRERGLLFLGPPGTGKTMLAKAIATGFNSPFVLMPGSGFAATFIGIDAIIVRLLARRAKKLARKWGGQCIVFIDEIDAVGMRRQSLGTGATGFDPITPLGYGDAQEALFFGPWGARTPSGDVVIETRAWRDRLFEQRAPQSGLNPVQAQYMRLMNFMFPGGMGGMGSLALNQLLVVMDGIDNPPFLRRVFTNKFNTMLDASFIVPRRIGRLSLRFPAARPRNDQVYFVGATNVPLERLDPALVRPGRMGRHVWFRTPTLNDRLDILDLYINKVSHDTELDQPKRRNEIARITGGYSPAMIEQVTSMALTKAHHSGRKAFVWEDLVDAITTLESGTAVGVDYVAAESRAIAIHEAGHAVAAHAFKPDHESTRLSIKMRGGSLGHHQAREKEERFGRFQSEEFAELVHYLGAMAAERVFYGENSRGVGGDVFATTMIAAYMVGASAMGPQPFDVEPLEGESVEQARERVLRRFESIGLQIMNRSAGGSMMSENPMGGSLGDPAKRRLAGQIIGQAYVTAHNLIIENRDATDRIAETLLVKKEIFGDDLMELLEAQKITVPSFDLNDEASWPPPFFALAASSPRALGRGSSDGRVDEFGATERGA